MCQCLEITRSSYYTWRHGKPSDLSQENAKLAKQVHEIFQVGRAVYGTRRIKEMLARRGLRLSRRRIARLMRQMN